MLVYSSRFFTSFDGSCCVGLFRCYTFSWPIFSGSLNNLHASLWKTEKKQIFLLHSPLCWSLVRLLFDLLLEREFKRAIQEIAFKVSCRNRVSNLLKNDKLVDWFFIVLSYICCETFYDSLHQHVVSKKRQTVISVPLRVEISSFPWPQLQLESCDAISCNCQLDACSIGNNHIFMLLACRWKT